MKKLALFLLLASIAHAQANSRISTGIITGNPKPSTCSIGQVWTDNTSAPAVLNLCTAANTWSAITSAASGTVITGTIAANQVAKGTAAGVIGASSITDDGTTITLPEIVGTSNAFTTGAAAGEIVVPNAKFYRSASQLNNANVPLIGLNASNVVSYDPNGQGGTMGGTLQVVGAITGSTSLLTPLVGGINTNTASTFQSGVDANTTGATATMTVRGENVTAGGSNNLAGGAVVIQGGIGTGTSTPAPVKIQSGALGLASANTQQSLVTRFVTHVKAGSTSSATPTTIFNIASATNTTWNVEILVGVQLISSTPNVCGTTEHFSLTGTNNNGAFGTVNIVAGTTSTLCSTGTLTLAVSATAANPSVISVTPTWGTITSITSATITVQIYNVSQQEITLL